MNYFYYTFLLDQEFIALSTTSSQFLLTKLNFELNN